MKKPHKLGLIAIDVLTGFRGTIVARVEYITGSDRYLVQPPFRKNKLSQAEWFDEARLDVSDQPAKLFQRPVQEAGES